VQRLFLRQTLDLGGETQAVAPDQNQLGGADTANRIIATIGKFSVVDIFDTNQFAHDARNDFFNWAVIDGGAFDYAADAWGYAYGASLEWYKDWWTLRGGVLNGSATPNSKFAAFPLGSQLQFVGEAEARYQLFGQSGKIKFLGFQTRARLATFAALEQFFATHPGASNVDAETIRHLRNKFGGEINIEQPLTADLGAFLRASFSDGRTEAYDFTDIDRSVSGGLSLTGGRWNRPNDTVGIAYVVDNISKAHKEYFEQGYLGPLIGDGRLTNAAPEQVLESYYSYTVRTGIKLTADYQLVARCIFLPGASTCSFSVVGYVGWAPPTILCRASACVVGGAHPTLDWPRLKSRERGRLLGRSLAGRCGSTSRRRGLGRGLRYQPAGWRWPEWRSGAPAARSAVR
jgi:high affinity Mn2+ porin